MMTARLVEKMQYLATWLNNVGLTYLYILHDGRSISRKDAVFGYMVEQCWA